MMTSLLRSVLIALLLAAASPLQASAQEPAVEMSSLLNALEVYPDGPTPAAGGRFGLDQFFVAFLPAECLYDGGALVKSQNQTWGVMRRKGESAELARWTLLAETWSTVFSRLRVVNSPPPFAFDRAGSYVFSIQIDEIPIAQVPLEIEFVESNDPFNPARKTYLGKSPMAQLAFVGLPNTGDPNGDPTITLWTRAGIFNPSGALEKLTLTVEQNGLVAFEANPQSLVAAATESGWKKHRFKLLFPKAQGGGLAKTKNLLSKDGAYSIFLRRQGALERTWQFKVSGGKIVPIARQQLGYAPHFGYLMGRYPSGDNPAVDLYWMEALGTEASAAAATTPVASGPTKAERAQWLVHAPNAPKAGFDLRVTAIATRMDGGIAVGPNLVAFGTGSRVGLSWVKVGEDQERTIPNSQEMSSSLFTVCGAKIIMTKGNQVVVYDTETGSSTVLPGDEIYLWRTTGGQYANNYLRSDGNLVVTLNDPKKVSDRAQVKVIDVSGSQPRIIALRGPEFATGDITTVAVDAGSGRVVVGSTKQQALYFAPITPNAGFEKFDLSAYDSIGRTSQLVLDGPRAIFFDGAGAQKLRLVDLDQKQLGTAGELLSERRYYDMRNGMLAYATNQSRGSNAGIALGRFGTRLNLPPGTGTGDIGMGQSVAISDSGLVFVAGDGKSGIGSGENLFVGDSTGWRSIMGADGQPLRAVDVVSGPGLIAFKTGKSNDTRVAYAIVGTGATLDQF